MAKKTRSRKPEAKAFDAWAEAKRTCRLSPRQIEMAKELGVNPRKLPALRPSPSQRWKLPVGQFIEELHRERFGSDELEEVAQHQHGTHLKQRGHRRGRLDGGLDGPAGQVQSLVCYAANLQKDLEAALATRRVSPELVADLAEELRTIAERLMDGQPVPELSRIDALAGPGDPDDAPADQDCVDDFDDIPF